jgi:hypothetical protein
VGKFIQGSIRYLPVGRQVAAGPANMPSLPPSLEKLRQLINKLRQLKRAQTGRGRKMVQKWFHAKTQRRKVQDIDNQ